MFNLILVPRYLPANSSRGQSKTMERDSTHRSAAIGQGVHADGSAHLP